MAFKDFLKEAARGAANAALDSYSDASKRYEGYARSAGRDYERQDVSGLKDLVNGKVDWRGNPIENDNDEDDW